MRNDDASRPERPRSEPEIIPPPRPGAQARPHVWIAVDEHGGARRVYVARPGPFAILLALLVFGLILAAVVLVLLGVVLFWIPVAILVVAALLLSGAIRHNWRRLRAWASGR